MQRLANWQSRLRNYLFDCSPQPVRSVRQFVAGAIVAMTGVDVAADLHWTYATREQACAALCTAPRFSRPAKTAGSVFRSPLAVAPGEANPCADTLSAQRRICDCLSCSEKWLRAARF